MKTVYYVCYINSGPVRLDFHDRSTQEVECGRPINGEYYLLLLLLPFDTQSQLDDCYWCFGGLQLLVCLSLCTCGGSRNKTSVISIGRG